jgi:hypothetical protein
MEAVGASVERARLGERPSELRETPDRAERIEHAAVARAVVVDRRSYVRGRVHAEGRGLAFAASA